MSLFNWNGSTCGFYRMNPEWVTDSQKRWGFIAKQLSQISGKKVEISHTKKGQPLRSDDLPLSISHKDDMLFFTTSTLKGQSLGCDLEFLGQKVQWSLFRRFFFNDGEIKSLGLSGDVELDHLKLLSLFSIKEAVFKCLARHDPVYLKQMKSNLYHWDLDSHSAVQLVSKTKGQWVFSICSHLDSKSTLI